MARKSPEELNEARRRKRQQEAQERLEQERLEEEAAAKRRAELKTARERMSALEEKRNKKNLLKSVLNGHYAEMDKLSKKAPSEQITELALSRINDLVKQCKDLLRGDPFIDSIMAFVPAGERPEHRDALLVLRELTQGIARFEEMYRETRAALAALEKAEEEEAGYEDEHEDYDEDPEESEYEDE